MPANFVGVSGDKGQVARLMGKPTLLFDNNIDNLNMLHSRADGSHQVCGMLVRRGRFAASASPRQYRMDPFADQYFMANDCNDWPGIVRRFNDHVRNPRPITADNTPPDANTRSSNVPYDANTELNE